jgi:hypothetical protein
MAKLVERIMRRCLEKEAANRLKSASDPQLGLRLVLAHLLGCADEVLAVCIETDRAFVSEHIGEGHDLVGCRKELVRYRFSL